MNVLMVVTTIRTFTGLVRLCRELTARNTKGCEARASWRVGGLRAGGPGGVGWGEA